MQMSAYDAAAWRAIQSWKQPSSARKVLPDGLQKRLASAGASLQRGAEQLPGAKQVAAAVEGALSGATSFVDRLAVASLRQKSVLMKYEKAGHRVAELASIRDLELQDIDRVKPRLTLRYTSGAGLEGVAAGAVMSGVSVGAAAGTAATGGAAAAPSMAVVLSTVAADSAAVLAASSRLVAETSAYYGYDPELPGEQLFAAAVLGVGLASQGAKLAAYEELVKLVRALATKQTWQVLDKNVVTKVVSQIYKRFGERLTKRKLGQMVPVVGIGLAAGLNAKTLHSVGDAAEMLYRERFLIEKYKLDLQGPVSYGSSHDAESPLMDILEGEVVDEAPNDVADGNG